LGRNNTMTVNEVAKLTGITIRTLHYYDQIGLLSPSIKTDTKYRIYTNDDLERLQEVLFFKEIGFSLKEIKLLTTSSLYNREEALQRHIKILELKRKRIDKLIALVKDTLAGKHKYSFDAFSNREILDAQAAIRKEVCARWENTKEYQEFVEYFSEHTERERNDKWNDLIMHSQNIFEQLAEFMPLPPSTPKVQAIVQEWQEYITDHFYPCSNEMLSYLGELYISDERFTTYINRFSNQNLAQFLNRAIQYYCQTAISEK